MGHPKKNPKKRTPVLLPDPVIRRWRKLRRKHPQLGLSVQLMLMVTGAPPYNGRVPDPDAAIEDLMRRVTELERHLISKGALTSAEAGAERTKECIISVRPFLAEFWKGIEGKPSTTDDPEEEVLERAWAIVNREFEGDFRRRLFHASTLLVVAVLGEDEFPERETLAETLHQGFCSWLSTHLDATERQELLALRQRAP